MNDEPGTGSPPMPTIERVAEAALRQLVADLVGQRARARDDADVALLEERRRDDPDVRLARREDARAVRADQAHARVVALAGVVDAQLVVGRDALGDRDRRASTPASAASRIESAAKRGGTKIIAVLAPRLGDGLGPRVEDRDALDVLAALAGRDAADDVGAVGAVVQRVERALAAGDAGDDEAGVLGRRGWPCQLRSFASATTFSAAPCIVFAGCTFGSAASSRIRRPSTSLVPSRRTTNGHVGVDLRERVDDALGDLVAAGDPAEDVEEDRLDASGWRGSPRRRRDRPRRFEPPPASRKLAGSPPAWATTSSVLITSPAPLPRMPMSPSSLTYVQALLLRHLPRSGRRRPRSRERRVLRVAVERVVVERDLRVERLDLAVGGDDQRVDLDEGRVLLRSRPRRALTSVVGDAVDDVRVDAAVGRDLQRPSSSREAVERVDVVARPASRGSSRRPPRCPCRPPC